MEKLLSENGIRSTKVRLDILNLLKNSNPLTAEEIFEKLQDKGAKLSSIYRNLALFEEKNILTKIVGINNFSYFQLNTQSHKHHLTCRKCNKTIAIEDCPIHSLEEKIETDTGFKITNHIFEFIGLCPDCQKE